MHEIRPSCAQSSVKWLPTLGSKSLGQNQPAILAGLVRCSHTRIADVLMTNSFLIEFICAEIVLCPRKKEKPKSPAYPVLPLPQQKLRQERHIYSTAPARSRSLSSSGGEGRGEEAVFRAPNASRFTEILFVIRLLIEFPSCRCSQQKL